MNKITNTPDCDCPDCCRMRGEKPLVSVDVEEQERRCTCRRFPGGADTNWNCPIHGKPDAPKASVEAKQDLGLTEAQSDNVEAVLQKALDAVETRGVVAPGTMGAHVRLTVQERAILVRVLRETLSVPTASPALNASGVVAEGESKFTLDQVMEAFDQALSRNGGRTTRDCRVGVRLRALLSSASGVSSPKCGCVEEWTAEVIKTSLSETWVIDTKEGHHLYFPNKILADQVASAYCLGCATLRAEIERANAKVLSATGVLTLLWHDQSITGKSKQLIQKEISLLATGESGAHLIRELREQRVEIARLRKLNEPVTGEPNCD